MPLADLNIQINELIISISNLFPQFDTFPIIIILKLKNQGNSCYCCIKLPDKKCAWILNGSHANNLSEIFVYMNILWRNIFVRIPRNVKDHFWSNWKVKFYILPWNVQNLFKTCKLQLLYKLIKISPLKVFAVYSSFEALKIAKPKRIQLNFWYQIQFQFCSLNFTASEQKHPNERWKNEMRRLNHTVFRTLPNTWDFHYFLKTF